MAAVVFWSCVVAVLGFLAYQELKEVTVELLLTTFVPAKRSDVFKVLLNPENLLKYKFHPFCVHIRNVVKSQNEKGQQTIQYEFTEHVKVLWKFYDRNITFDVMTTVVQPDAVITNKAMPEGLLILNQRWLLTDFKEGDEDGTLIEDKIEFTGRRFFARIAKSEGYFTHNNMLRTIKQHFEDSF